MGLLRTVWSWHRCWCQVCGGFCKPTGLTRNTLSPCCACAEVQGAAFLEKSIAPDVTGIWKLYEPKL
jgi:hypothetical protein